MNQVAKTFENKYLLSNYAAAVRLEEWAVTLRAHMTAACQHVLHLGRDLIALRAWFQAENGLRGGFKVFIEDELGLDPSYAYKMIKAWETYGKDAANIQGVAAGVLVVLLQDKNPQERLAEALAIQEEQGKVTIREAKQLIQKAKAVVESGEQETFEVPVAPVEPIVVPDHSDTVVTEQTYSLSRAKRIKRAKSVLKTVIELLALETSNTEVTDEDFADAVAEMLLSSDEAEVEAMSQLREFCTILCKPII